MSTSLFSAVVTTASLALALAPMAYSQATPQQYTRTNLVSNVSGQAAVTDPNLQNVWGLSRSSNGDWWVSDNTSGLSTLYVARLAPSRGWLSPYRAATRQRTLSAHQREPSSMAAGALQLRPASGVEILIDAPELDEA